MDIAAAVVEDTPVEDTQVAVNPVEDIPVEDTPVAVNPVVATVAIGHS